MGAREQPDSLRRGVNNSAENTLITDIRLEAALASYNSYLMLVYGLASLLVLALILTAAAANRGE